MRRWPPLLSPYDNVPVNLHTPFLFDNTNAFFRFFNFITELHKSALDALQTQIYNSHQEVIRLFHAKFSKGWKRKISIWTRSIT